MPHSRRSSSGFASAPTGTPFPLIPKHDLMALSHPPPGSPNEQPNCPDTVSWQKPSGSMAKYEWATEGWGRERATGFKSQVMGNNETVPPSSQPARGADCPFKLGVPAQAAEITGHRELAANCFDKAVTVVRVQGCRPLGQRLPIKRTEKAAHWACDFHLGRNYPWLFLYLSSASD